MHKAHHNDAQNINFMAFFHNPLFYYAWHVKLIASFSSNNEYQQVNRGDGYINYLLNLFSVNTGTTRRLVTSNRSCVGIRVKKLLPRAVAWSIDPVKIFP